MWRHFWDAKKLVPGSSDRRPIHGSEQPLLFLADLVSVCQQFLPSHWSKYVCTYTHKTWVSMSYKMMLRIVESVYRWPLNGPFWMWPPIRMRGQGHQAPSLCRPSWQQRGAVCLAGSLSIWSLFVCLSPFTHVYIYIHTYVYTFYICIHMYMYIYTHTYIYTYICT